MIIQLLYTVLFLAAYFGVIQLSELLYRRFNVKAGITRKIAHVIGSLSSLIFLLLFQSHLYVLIIAGVFFMLLFISKRKGIYNSIDLVERETMGSYILPVSIYILYLVYEITDDTLYFILPILVLGISDPLAGLAGMSSNKLAKVIEVLGYNFQKTYLGSLSFFLSTLLISFLVFNIFHFSEQNLLLAFYFAFTTTLVEVFSKRGLDNLTVPLVSVLLIWIFTL